MKYLVVTIWFLIGATFITGCSMSDTKCNNYCCYNTSQGESFDLNDLSVTSKDTIDYSNKSLACTLIGQVKLERKEELKAEIFSTVKAIEEHETGYIFSFDESEEFLHKLLDYIIVEKECCPFLEYDFTILPYGQGIHLNVSGEGEAKDIISIFVETH
jgi:hypothetical protein